ncbi:MAG TPA: DUF4833 domain-containing protein [Labilithrix sp.]|nr:DUF4833 domain-containing protein [Labilithrix sp.]
MNLRQLSFSGLVAALVVAAAPAVAHADPSFGANDIRTLFAIKKSENKNEVHYGIHLDAACLPVGEAPIFAYWQDYEKGPNVVADLGMLEKSAYGIKGQWVKKRTAEESKILMSLNATPDRGIMITTTKKDGKCVSETLATINKEPALLEQVFVHIAGFLSVDWIELRGLRFGKPMVERVRR